MRQLDINGKRSILYYPSLRTTKLLSPMIIQLIYIFNQKMKLKNLIIKIILRIIKINLGKLTSFRELEEMQENYIMI